MEFLNTTTNNNFQSSDHSLPDQCCLDTIDKHSENNKMMVCPHCNSIIKCFMNEKEYINYLIFCNSKKRNIKTTHYNGFFIIAFNPYNT